MKHGVQLIVRLILLGIPSLLALFLAVRLIPVGQWPRWGSSVTYGVMATSAALLAFRFHRGNTLFQVVTLVGVWMLGSRTTPGTATAGMLAPALLWLFCAANLAFSDWMKDRGIYSFQALMLGLLALSEAGLVMFAHRLAHAGMPLPSGTISLVFNRHTLHLPVITLIVCFGAFLFLLIRFFRNSSPTTAAVTWAAVLVSLAYPGVASVRLHELLPAAAVLAILSGLVEQSFRMAYVDELTGIQGRRALHEAMERLRGNYAIAMADVDHFKRFNDTWGHETGDQVLKRVAAELNRVRGGHVYRYGGEEFAVLFPGLESRTARSAMDEVRKRIRNTGFTVRDRRQRKKGSPERRGSGSRRSRRVTITISAGVAACGNGNRTPQEVLKAADRALYRAKRAGRNRVLS